MMPKQRTLLACTLALGLSGCVAAPLAQMAVTQMTKQPCAAGSGCSTDPTAGSFGSLSKGMTDSFQKLMGNSPDSQTASASTPAK